MEKAVEQLEAMFQKAESDVNNLSQKLKYDFGSNEDVEVNTVRLIDKISDAKTEYSALKEEVVAIQDAQKEAVKEFKDHITNVCTILQRLQSKQIMAGDEKPEEIKQLEELLGMCLPTNSTSHSALKEEASLSHSVDSGVNVDRNTTEWLESSTETKKKKDKMARK